MDSVPTAAVEAVGEWINAYPGGVRTVTLTAGNYTAIRELLAAALPFLLDDAAIDRGAEWLYRESGWTDIEAGRASGQVAWLDTSEGVRELYRGWVRGAASALFAGGDPNRTEQEAGT